MNPGLTKDCCRLLDFGIDPINLIAWAHRNQLRVVIDAALPRTLLSTRNNLYTGVSYVTQSGYEFDEKAYDKPEHIVPPDPVYHPPLIR